MPESSKTVIAKILTAHGVRGLVKLRVFLEAPGDVEDYPLTDQNGKEFTVKLKNAIKEDWVADIGLTDRNDAEKLRNVELFTELEEIEDEGTFYYNELVGLEARNAQGEKLGVIDTVDNFGAGDIIKIKPLSGASYYLPMVEPYVQEINTEAGFVIIEPHEEFMS